MTTGTPEIGHRVRIGELDVNYHDTGEGSPVLLIHGSGPGVTAWANWRLVIPRLQENHRVIAPDMMGFGYTDAPAVHFDLDTWAGQLTGLLDLLGVRGCHVIGNSFGGAVALRLALRHPRLVDRLVLMGPVGVSFPITAGLEDVWGYSPSWEAMSHLVRDVFVYDRASITDDLVDLRYGASTRPGVQERFAALFPPPRQRWVDRLAMPESDLRRIPQEVLVVHGREDKVIPIAASQRLVGVLPHARLETIPECGHWVQIEHTDTFCRLAEEFLGKEKEEAA